MKSRIVLSILTLGALALGAACAFSQGFPLGLLPSATPSAESVSAYVWTEEPSVRVGEGIRIFLRASRPAFLYLFDLQPDGVVRLLFPNTYSFNNYLVSGIRILPDGPYQLIAAPPVGIEELLVIATDSPLPLPIGSPTDPFPIFAEDPHQAIGALVNLLNMLNPRAAWGIGWHAIQILEPEPRQEEELLLIVPGPTEAPPFLARAGDTCHRIQHAWYPGIPSVGWYWYYGLDSRWHLCLVVP